MWLYYDVNTAKGKINILYIGPIFILGSKYCTRDFTGLDVWTYQYAGFIMNYSIRGY